MPSRCAASMTVVPAATSIDLPSISSLGMSDVRRHEALFVIDVMLKLVAEMLDEALHRQRCRIAQRANGASRDVVRNGYEEIQIFVFALAILDALHDSPQPA